MPKQTIQQFLDSGDTYSIWCHNPRCGHHAKLDMEKLRDRLGPDHGSLHDDIIHMFRCSKCQGKELGLQRQPKGNEQRNSYAKAKGD